MTKEKDEVMIYSDDWSNYDDEEVNEECPNKSDDEYTFFINARWRDMSADLDILNNKYPAFVLTGYFQGWRGNQNVAAVECDIHKLIQKGLANGISYTSFYRNKEGEMIVYDAHHDGTSRYEIRGLTKEGYDWYQEHKDASQKEIVERLWCAKAFSEKLYEEASK